MKKCCICGNGNLKEDADILFIDKNGNYKEICDKCSSKLEITEKNENNKEVRMAIRYFKNYIDESEDYEVIEFLNKLIDKIDNPKPATISPSNQSENTQYSSIWIKFFKALSYLIFITVIIIGIVLGVSIGDFSGFGIFLLSIIIAFMLVGGIMIYLDIASDIRTIKNTINKV